VDWKDKESAADRPMPIEETDGDVEKQPVPFIRGYVCYYVHL